MKIFVFLYLAYMSSLGSAHRKQQQHQTLPNWSSGQQTSQTESTIRHFLPSYQIRQDQILGKLVCSC